MSHGGNAQVLSAKEVAERAKDARIHRQFVWGNTIGSGLATLGSVYLVIRLGFVGDLYYAALSFLLLCTSLAWAVTNFLGFLTKDDKGDREGPA